MRAIHNDVFPMTLLLFINEESFYKVIKRLDTSEFPDKGCVYPLPGGAHTIAFTGADIGLIIMVTLGEMENDKEAESIITHEAVHVKQFLFDNIGETHPGNETEAYFIQWVTDALIDERQYLINKAAKKAAKEQKDVS